MSGSIPSTPAHFASPAARSRSRCSLPSSRTNGKAVRGWRTGSNVSDNCLIAAAGEADRVAVRRLDDEVAAPLLRRQRLQEGDACVCVLGEEGADVRDLDERHDECVTIRRSHVEYGFVDEFEVQTG